MDKKYKIVQLANAHSGFDNRIFNKISKSLASYGYNVDLIVQHEKDELVEGVHIKALPIAKNKIDRFFKVMPMLFYKSIQYPFKTIFHFHEPELIPVAMLLKLFGYTIIYDIHEDNSAGVLEKEYLPTMFKSAILKVVLFFEGYAHKHFYTIIAEHYYEERFPDAVKILNYPNLEWAENINFHRENPKDLLYTGSVTIDRGALIHSELLNQTKEFENLQMIGVCSETVYKAIKQRTDKNSERLLTQRSSEFVYFQDIIAEYKKDNWIAGLAIFPESEFYKRKHLTKFYEYMAAGLPIIYTNFPEWKKLLEPLNVGIAVDPENPEEAVSAITRIKNDSTLRLQMAENGRRVVFENYDWRVEELKLKDLYKKIVQSLR